MLYAIFCYDKPESVELRMKTRPAHLDYVSSAGARLKIAGPMLTPGDDPQPVGSIIILDAASEAAAMLFAENDPYNKAGLFDRVDIRPWKAALGTWVPKDA